ncbi:CBS domain-containing protein [Capnocytophaga stomatis]|uniref:CBS domain-containing protein n=1 Tax=Capnocytophaga stomatis TaxID=1848904 RepID=A0A250FWT5_9FLAO|nr:CBS domain-containing protein [Capnocytophaga stomatis]ATA89471.1 CBS domain-containing protein [Capnocytophaga stomatis]GIJ94767.1 membrane protein [Capnocytophaga stomatis]GIJ97759.1 membrane protein [Capnocytophaga stomatis]GIM49983.1 membrane protein [Capnocytophaga stomatis]
MKQRVPISQIMSRKLITLTPTQSLYDAERLFKKHKIRHIPVVESDRIIGIVSYSDLLRISFADMTDNEDEVTSVVYDMYTIPQIMAKTPLTVNSDATIKEVAEILSKQSFHSIPVLENDKLVGIVTTTDLINYLLEQY